MLIDHEMLLGMNGRFAPRGDLHQRSATSNRCPSYRAVRINDEIAPTVAGATGRRNASVIE
jgi:hypothetical protein